MATTTQPASAHDAAQIPAGVMTEREWLDLPRELQAKQLIEWLYCDRTAYARQILALALSAVARDAAEKARGELGGNQARKNAPAAS